MHVSSLVYVLLTYKKQKESLHRLIQGYRRMRFQSISKQSAAESGKVVSPEHWPALPPTKYSAYSFLLEAESTPEP